MGTRRRSQPCPVIGGSRPRPASAAASRCSPRPRGRTRSGAWHPAVSAMGTDPSRSPVLLQYGWSSGGEVHAPAAPTRRAGHTCSTGWPANSSTTATTTIASPVSPEPSTRCWRLTADVHASGPEQVEAPPPIYRGDNPLPAWGDTSRGPVTPRHPGSPMAAPGVEVPAGPGLQDNWRRAGTSSGTVTNRPKTTPSQVGVPRRTPAHETGRRGGGPDGRRAATPGPAAQ